MTGMGREWAHWTSAADIVAVSHEADLALLTVEDDGFWSGDSMK